MSRFSDELSSFLRFKREKERAIKQAFSELDTSTLLELYH